MIRAIGSALRARDAEVPVAAWVAVVAVAGLGYAGSLAALLQGWPLGTAREIAVVVLILAPLPVGPALLPGRQGSALRRWLVLLVAGLQVVLALQVGRLDDGSTLAAVFAAAQGHALVRSTQAGAAALSLALALSQSASALRVEPSDAGMGALVLQFTLALTGLVLMHSVGARRLAARNRRVAASLADVDHQVGGRTRYALRLAAVLALPALGLLALGARLGNGTWLARGPHVERPQVDEGSSAARDESARLQTQPGLWRDSLSYGEGVGRLSDEVVLWARPRVPGEGRVLQDVRALWLAVLALDTFDAGGLSNPRLDRVQPVSDGEDGRLDGWIELGVPAGELFELEIVQRPLRVAASVGDALVSSRPLVALEAPRTLYDPDGVLVLPEGREDWFVYRQRCVAPWSLPGPSSGVRARHPEPRFTQLPPPSGDMERIAAQARRILSAARDDAGRVRLLLDHFAREFDYSLQGSGFAGLPGVLAFLEAKQGYCTSFAAAAVLLLRTQRVACRAVGGYLAHEWDAEQGAFVVRGRHAHAWIEVYFEGLGWRTFDPTPARRREEAFARALAPGPAEVGEWGAELAAALRSAVLDDGPAGALERVGRVLARAPEVVGASVGRRPLVWGGGLTLLLLALAAVWRRRVGRGLARAGVRLPGAPPPVGAYERLLELLARRGLAPRSTETLREFSRRAVGFSGVPDDLPRATEIFYRARFGGLEPGADERAWLEDLLARARAALGVGDAFQPDP